MLTYIYLASLIGRCGHCHGHCPCLQILSRVSILARDLPTASPDSKHEKDHLTKFGIYWQKSSKNGLPVLFQLVLEWHGHFEFYFRREIERNPDLFKKKKVTYSVW